ncbi:MAG: hypothetical protein ACRDOL_23050 [Streptosporangiaceae bacterium]
MHRQTYIDLIRAYLIDYGSQRDLSRALGLSEAYASYLLEPLRLASDRRQAEHWSVPLCAAGYEVAEAFKYVKTPTEVRARQIAEQLLTDGDRRDVLRYHISMARRRALPSLDSPAMSASTARAALEMIGEIHQASLYDPTEQVTASSYARVWEKARDLPALIDPRFNPTEYAQALLYLHDTAQVLGRPDLALGFARQAIRALPAAQPGLAGSPGVVRLRINAIFAEIVTLNTLRLHRDALLASEHAESLPGFGDEPQTWLRSFLEQRLTSMTGVPRASVYLAESTADRAAVLIPGDWIAQASVTRRLMDVYLSRITARRIRKAGRLADDLHCAVPRDSGMSPLRRTQILRSLITYHRRIADTQTAADLIAECLQVATEANLIHQRDELVREVT